MANALLNPSVSVAFTGHRFISFEKQTELRKQLRRIIIEQYKQGMTNFFCGMAIGFDLLAAEIVLSLKESCPSLNLVAVIPFRGQAEKWNSQHQARYRAVLDKADKVFVLSENYYNGCLLRRNDFMLAHVCRLISYFDGEPKGGTYYTFQKAKSKGLPIINLY